MIVVILALYPQRLLLSNDFDIVESRLRVIQSKSGLVELIHLVVGKVDILGCHRRGDKKQEGDKRERQFHLNSI